MGLALTYFLHCYGKGILCVLERRVDVFFARDLVSHFDAFVVEDLVGFFYFFVGVVDDHFGGAFLSKIA